MWNGSLVSSIWGQKKKKKAKQNHQTVSQGGNAASNSVGNSSGKLGSKYSQCPWCSRAAEGDAGRSRGVCERRGVGIRGVRGPGRDVRHHPVQTELCTLWIVNTEVHPREGEEQGTRFVYLAQALGRGAVGKGHGVQLDSLQTRISPEEVVSCQLLEGSSPAALLR